ncbi:MAG: DNA mismatch repair endonuclease MutL [Halanaeroarchaeum sp.]
MSERITRLDQRTVERIAAGEVVERPASVVKELVENSLDADADRIDVSVDGDGTDRIVVADDGIGMDEADLRAAVQQHTTSKIRDITDLAEGVGTLGFRGEALFTIGAVSRMTITSRPRDGGDVGTELRLVGGEVESVDPTGRPPGTTVTVEDLFYNTPARRKYLKTEATEFAHVNRVVTRYALANPAVAVTLSHDGGQVFSTTGSGDVQETLLSVYGRQVAESMIRVDHDVEHATVRGYVSDPETTRSAREYVSTYVNGRYVRDGGLRSAIVSAYGNQLAADRYPFAVLFVEVPPASVDVNVHPRKMEVRFDEAEAVHDAIETAVEDALLDHGLVRTRAPRGRSAPDDTPVAPGERESPDGSAAEDDVASDPEDAVREADSLQGIDRGGSSAAGESDRGHRDGAGATGDSSWAPDEAGVATAGGDDTTDSPGSAADSPADGPGADREPSRKFAGPVDQPGLTGVDPDVEFETLPSMRVLGQALDTYIVAETPDGLVLVDQHAADERINYERLAGELAARTDSQRLVSPVELDLTAHEASVFEGALGDLRDAGFDVRKEDRTAVVEAVPAVFDDALDPDVLRDVLASFLEEREDVVDSAADALLADMACYPSITGNTSLREGDVLDLLTRLDACENPFSCPHGRPVVIELSEGELADRFERDYPGHAVRRPED